jgi:hypothetical protein
MNDKERLTTAIECDHATFFFFVSFRFLAFPCHALALVNT